MGIIIDTPQLQKHIDMLISRYQTLSDCKEKIIVAYNLMEQVYENHGKLLIAGNGGSAADSEHIAGELMKKFKLPRPVDHALSERLISIDSVRGSKLVRSLEKGLPAIALTSHTALYTAVINDTDGEMIFAQELISLGKPGDVFLGISTSGNSKNIMNAAVVARALDIKVIGLTGAGGGELANFADVAVKVPEMETYKIQELHLPIYHCWCTMLEEHFFGDDYYCRNSIAACTG